MNRPRCFVCNRPLRSEEPRHIKGRFFECEPCHQKGKRKKPAKRP